MKRFLLATLVFCLPMEAARALPFSVATLSPGEQCRTGIAAAERGHAIPPQLMAAIGRVESGKRDPGTGAWGAWPWTINAEGQGYYFNTKAEAINAVQTLQARGVRSIDVGCMQVNLMHHPTAFPNLDMAFEPATNADYAARFLVDLHGQTGDWTKATANYHSANPAEGGPYADKVTSVWPEEQRKAGMTPLPIAGPGFAGAFSAASPPFPVHQPLRMFAMAGKMPAGMMKGDTGVPYGAATAHSEIAPPGMMQGGTIPAGTLPGGIMRGGMMQVRAASPDAASGQPLMNPGRGLDFYRAIPVRTATAPIRLMAPMSNKTTTR
jgi:hypothetical protein